ATLTDLPTWAEVAPPKGTVFNYPLKPHHEAKPYIALSPAPPEIAVQMYTQAIQTKMIARMVQNKEPVDRVLAWAEREIEGFKRGCAGVGGRPAGPVPPCPGQASSGT